MELIVGISIFITIVLVIVGIFYLLKGRHDPETVRVQKELRVLSMKKEDDLIVDILRKRRRFSSIPWLDALLGKIPFMQKIDLLLQQSDTKYPVGIFVLITCFLTCVGFLFVAYFTKNILISILAAGLMGMIPFLYLSAKKKARTKKFEQLLPQALDTIARSLRAGHAFLSGLQTVAQEFPDPVGGEFAKVVDETNFGAGIKEALLNLTGRVDSQDLRFFTIAVTIQRETGGDLAEILENIAKLMRERFKLYDRIRTLSAEGKLSAVILIAIPIFIVFVISFINPNHMRMFVTDPIGKMLAGLSIFMMAMGVTIMRKLILAIKI
ncbi:hypothetical protein MTYM_00584 [Methylococcales bacterium]|nr:hypothetical protein MTYM_00584 [Methylococcales bacterium]